ncbi:MAG: membrane protein insertase YidC [Deltaproteobacteria bacterium]|nr:membrane protein insertase YidC [Deltaproteobacteria bacterium]
MEDRRTALAILLAIIVIMVYSEVVMAPYNRPILRQTEQTESPSQAPASGVANQQTPASQTIHVPPASVSTTPTREQYLVSPSITLESDELSVKVSLLGGRITSFALKPYKVTLGQEQPIDLVDPLSKTFPLGVYSGGVDDAAVEYKLTGVTTGILPDSNTYIIPSDTPLSLNLTGTLPNGIEIKKTLRFSNQSFFFDVELELSAPPPDGSRVWIEWVSFLSQAKATSERWNLSAFVLLNQDNSVTRIDSSKAPLSPTESADRWISFGDNYFFTAIIPAISGPNTSFWKDDDSFIFRAVGAKQEGKFKFYAGPKSPEFFGDGSFELKRSIDLGWFAFIGQPILIGIELLHSLLGNYGLAIILLTLILKAVLLPLTKSSFKSMKAMQDLQPEIKAMRERIKDPNELNQATMELFKRHGVNPMGGCLPVFLQLPIFLGMYNALRTSFHLRHANFALWINDLAAPERLHILGVPVPVMILIMGATMLIQQITTPTSAPPEQRRMMLLMPLFFTGMFIIWPFPSGLVLYWLVNNLISIVQQVTLRSERHITPLQATALGSAAIFGFGFVLTLL